MVPHFRTFFTVLPNTNFKEESLLQFWPQPNSYYFLHVNFCVRMPYLRLLIKFDKVNFELILTQPKVFSTQGGSFWTIVSLI